MQASPSEPHRSSASTPANVKDGAPGWYYPAIGIVGGAGVIAFGVLPQQAAGLFLVVAVLVIGVLGFFAGKLAGRNLSVPRTGAAIGYVLVLAIIVIGALIVSWTVARGSGATWVAWVLGVIVFVVLAGGTWMTKPGRVTQ
ncbi:flagellar motor component MotA [Microbacterium resistens]|uniref:Flagellar motor component MotA n=1 Tax=Microbacterium resistens TaxID=156977 RepID=A0ABU1SGM8_9MICO|nr:hypothetical protein [Microbacterium resistens]MDR6868779.1 flagellar motor component MotA [Microbacterium resistens]